MVCLCLIFIIADCSIPEPIAFFPDKNKYTTEERNCSCNAGSAVEGVYLGPGPCGETSGSYQFNGACSCHIPLPMDGILDVRRGFTIIFWLYLSGISSSGHISWNGNNMYSKELVRIMVTHGKLSF